MQSNLTQPEGNEVLVERFIDAIENGTCKIADEYPRACELDGVKESFLPYDILLYFLYKGSFSCESSIAFCEKLRKLCPSGFNAYSYQLSIWIEKNIQKKYFKKSIKNGTTVYALKSDADLSTVNPEVLSFICYVAVCHVKYGASYETITANNYFQFVTDLGSKEVDFLKKNGTGKLPKDITEYKDSNITYKANDVFATIKIKVISECEESYITLLKLICNLLKTDFPKSYSISYTGKVKNTLPIKGLPKKGCHYLFANAIKYPNAQPHIAEYATLAMKTYEWYNDLEDEESAMPSTFAVFALGLESEKYFDIVKKYMEEVDGEHQSMQEKFTPVFIEKYGVNKQTLPVYVNCVCSMQEHKPNKIFTAAFSTKENLELLLGCKNNFVDYFPEKTIEDWKDGSTVEEMLEYIWENVLYTTFGLRKNYEGIMKKASPELKPLYEKVFEMKTNG